MESILATIEEFAMLTFGRTWVYAAVFLCLAIGGQASAQWGGGQSRWRNILDQPDGFYGSDESVRIAENVLLYQNNNGGWPKNIDMARPLSDGQKAKLAKQKDTSETLIDNGATWTQIRFLAQVHAATGDERFADAARRGLEYLLAAQYPNGGWPMIYPLRKGYYSHITFNDGAMIGVMELLRDVADGKPPFDFVDSQLRDRCRHATEKGLDVILQCQVVVDGKPTVWCAQHDEHTFAPAAARTYELPSLSGYESVGVVQYLMGIDDPSPEVQRAIEGAIEWFQGAKINGLRVEWVRDNGARRPRDRVAIHDPNAEPIWARFYEIGTNRPMFVGRDGVIHDHLEEIEQERRLGYAWLGDWPRQLLERDYPKWQKKRGG